jgi:hypothetical protein
MWQSSQLRFSSAWWLCRQRTPAFAWGLVLLLIVEVVLMTRFQVGCLLCIVAAGNVTCRQPPCSSLSRGSNHVTSALTNSALRHLSLLQPWAIPIDAAPPGL